MALDVLNSLNFAMWAPAGTPVPMPKTLHSNYHMPQTEGGAFILPSVAPVSSVVSVRILHDFLRVRCRSKSGSLVHGRISGGISVLGKSAQPLLVVARRGMASKRNDARGLLPPARAVDQDVRTLDEASDQQGRSPRTCEIPAGFASGRATPAAREEWQEVSETALFRTHGHPLACASGVLGDACGSHELERDRCSRICLRPAAFASRVAQMAGPYRERRGGDRLVGPVSLATASP